MMKRLLTLLLVLLPAAAAMAQEFHVKMYPQARLSGNVRSGQYSGITYLGEELYAVVDDKLPGGGIVYMHIPVRDYGRVRMGVPEATSSGSVKGRDNEGIAFVPATQRLWVSSEADQRIREYSLDGVETGRELRIPAAFGTGGITPNMGFEALTFDPATALFWTVSEGPLKGESVHRLQSFTFDGNPRWQYLYEMDAPTQSRSGATSYVFGIPALAALDDGRLLVLEREVYVPGGGVLDKAFRSFTRMKLYVVNPVGAPDGTLLEKQPFAAWTTSALNLANFEGMCLGPTLSDGSRCLLLIADSQGGSGGLTSEYIKLITF